MTPTIKLLKKACDHIAGDGMFWPGRYFKGRANTFITVRNGPCCPLGAIGWAANCHPDSFKRGQTQRLADDELCITANKTVIGGAVSFSDTPGRTQPEIVALFNDTIKRLEATL